MVSSSNGTIDVKSKVGQGTTFTINLPVYKKSDSAETSEKKSYILIPLPQILFYAVDESSGAARFFGGLWLLWTICGNTPRFVHRPKSHTTSTMPPFIPFSTGLIIIIIIFNI